MMPRSISRGGSTTDGGCVSDAFSASISACSRISHIKLSQSTVPPSICGDPTTDTGRPLPGPRVKRPVGVLLSGPSHLRGWSNRHTSVLAGWRESNPRVEAPVRGINPVSSRCTSSNRTALVDLVRIELTSWRCRLRGFQPVEYPSGPWDCVMPESNRPLLYGDKRCHYLTSDLITQPLIRQDSNLQRSG